MEKTKLRANVSFPSKFTVVEQLNSEFTLCKAYVCALGKNRNLSYIAEKAADAALPSLFNIPIIGYLYKDDDGNLHMGGHEGEVIKDKDGNYVWHTLCRPYGVVPIQDNVHYEEITEPDGHVKTYVVCDCILWTGKYPELQEAIYSEDWMFNQSMEINVLDYAPLEGDSRYTDIQSYEYSALCLLGRSDDKEFNVEPCFPVSHVEQFDHSYFELMDQMRKDLSECFSEKSYRKEEHTKMDNEPIVDTSTETVSNEEAASSETITLGDMYTLADSPEPVEVPIEASEEPNEQPEATFDEEGGAENQNPEEPEVVELAEESLGSGDEELFSEDPKMQFKLTYLRLLEKLEKAMPVDDDNYFYPFDFNDKEVFVKWYHWNGEDTENRMGKFEYAYFEDSDTVTLGQFTELFCELLTAEESEELARMREEYEALVSYKATKEEEDRKASFDAAIKEFADDLSGNEEFDKLAGSDDKYSFSSVDALRDACYIIRGKYGVNPKARKSPAAVGIKPVAENSETLREKLHKEYGRK